MKRGFAFLLIIILLVPNVYAYSFSNFIDDLKNTWDRIGDFITGYGKKPPIPLPPSEGESESEGGIPPPQNPTPESTTAGSYDISGGGNEIQSCGVNGCTNLYRIVYEGQNTVLAVPWIIKELKFCSDGTLYGECSINVPKFCDSGNLIYNCNTCGCPAGFGECKEDGSCEVVETCKEAGGICDSSCGVRFEHVKKFDDSCSSDQLAKDVTPLTTVSGEVVSDSVNCCVPIKKADFTNETYINYSKKGWINVSFKRKITNLFGDFCTDKSHNGKCSKIKPLYCSKGELYNFCSKCGCEEDEICNIFTNNCIDKEIAKKKAMFNKFSELSEDEKDVMADFLLDVYNVDRNSDNVRVVKKDNGVSIFVGDVVLDLDFDTNGKPRIGLDIPDLIQNVNPKRADEGESEGMSGNRKNLVANYFKSAERNSPRWAIIIVGLVVITVGLLIWKKKR